MMENKEFETNKKSYNRLPDEQPVKKFDETNHVKVQKENIEDDLLLQPEKKSFNRLPDEPVTERSVQEQYKSDTKDSKNNE